MIGRNRLVSVGVVTVADVNPRPALSFVRCALAAAARAAHDAYEDSPLAAHRLSDKIMDAHIDRAEAVAMTNPVYAEIQARRETGSGSSLWGMNAERHLGQAEYDTQESIRDRLTPDPLWWPLVRRVRARPVRDVVRGGMYAYQRAVRGWSDDDTWDLGTRLCTTLAAQLNHLADTARGWPGGEEFAGGNDYAEPEDWTAALRQAATGLEGWATHWDSPAERAALNAVGGPPNAQRLAADLHTVDNAARLAAAQEALRWVATNLNDLWD